MTVATTTGLPGEAEYVDELEFKTATEADGRVVDVDETEGLVTAVVSVTGVIDEVDDNIAAGAYTDTLTKRRPKVVFHHDWKAPIARVERIAELRPGDTRLPTETKDGKPWPTSAGALVATMRFNLKTHAGREAFEVVRFYSETGECDWSIGYAVPPGKATKDKQGVRHIKVMDLYEISFVLFGAAPLTGTLSLKSAAAEARQRKQDSDGDVSEMHRAAADEVDWDEVEAAADRDPGSDGDGDGDEEGDGGESKTSNQPWSNFTESDYTLTQWHRACLIHQHDGQPTAKDQCKLPVRQPDGTVNRNGVHAAAAALVGARGGVQASDEEKRSAARKLRRLYSQLDEEPPESLRRTAGQEGKARGRDGDRNRGGAENLREWYVHGEGAARIRWGQPGDFGRCVRIASDYMTREQAKGYCNLRHRDALGVWAGQEHDKTADAGEVKQGGEPAVANGVMVALYPPREVAEQVAVDGGTEPGHLHVTLAYLGTAGQVEATPRQVADAVRAAAADMPPLRGTVGGIGRFPDAGDGAPVWVPVDVAGLGMLRETVVAALEDAGVDVAGDHGFNPHLTLGYGVDAEPFDPTPVVFDAVTVAWGSERTTIPLAGGGGKAAGYDPALEVGPDAGHLYPLEAKHMGQRMAGSYEEHLETVTQAVTRQLRGQPRDDDGDRYEWDFVDVVGTWPDRVVATRFCFDGANGGRAEESYEIGYDITGGGEVVLGEPEPVDLTVTVTHQDSPTGGDAGVGIPIEDLLPLLAMLGDTAGKSRGLLLDRKAGRVLSEGNATRLRAAVEHLIHVLRAAGVDIDTGGGRTETPPSGDGMGEKTTLDPGDYLRGLRVFLDAH